MNEMTVNSYEVNFTDKEEELGITGVKLKPIKKILYTSRTGSKFCYFYNLEVPIDTQFKIQENELEQVKWFSKEELKNLLNTKPEDFVHALELLKEFFLEIK
jgi:isopentenyldiphosphate isomerase